MPSGRVRAARRARRPRAVLRHPDSGFATLEAVVVLPVLVLFTMLVIQFVLLWHGRNVAQAAARDALRVARGYQATAGQGEAAGQQYIQAVAAHILPGAQVQVSRSATTVTVTVTAPVESAVPLAHWHVTSSAVGSTEEFVAP